MDFFELVTDCNACETCPKIHFIRTPFGVFRHGLVHGKIANRGELNLVALLLLFVFCFCAGGPLGSIYMHLPSPSTADLYPRDF